MTEPLIYDLSSPGRTGALLPNLDVPEAPLPDNLLRDSLAALFEESSDPIDVIKWKEIYETMETVTDRCEDVANVIEGIILKMA